PAAGQRGPGRLPVRAGPRGRPGGRLRDLGRPAAAGLRTRLPALPHPAPARRHYGRPPTGQVSRSPFLTCPELRTRLQESPGAAAAVRLPLRLHRTRPPTAACAAALYSH